MFFVCSGRNPDHVCGGRLSHACVHHPGDDSYIQDVSSVDERPGRGLRKLGEPAHSLLCCDEGTVHTDCRHPAKVGQCVVEWVLRWGERGGAGCGYLFSKDSRACSGMHCLPL